MDAAHANADCAFLGKKPFGFLMALQTAFSLFIVLLVVFAPFVFEGVSFVSACAFTLFCSSLIYNLFHIMGWNRKLMLYDFEFVRLIITYFFLLYDITCAANAFICLRLGILLFRAAPNSQILALTTVIIDGDKTSRSVVVSFPGLFS
ncbi:unnamed protein product [Angiostrongylus costaricensis]|uniref:MARVEL domain-containing protein n=1 Tax=Angiostrongylus costaricensis TaxID=334426 RepID=A0A158PFN5_ANGCS|nr:unnamed protein product [Angiostrongylus costaricensis]